VNRHNYLPPRSIAPHLRGPAAAVVAALLVVAATGTIEVRRAEELDATLAIASERAARTADTAERAAALDAEVLRLRRLDAALGQIRRDAVLRVNDLASIGNHLPERTWLTAVRTDRGGAWTIEGRSARLPEIGATLAGLQALDAAAPVRLISVAVPGEGAKTLRFAIAWDRHP
jgi:hypothetical protein